MKHVPRQGSRTYGELERALRPAKKTLAPPDHVKQLVEIDVAKGLSRTINLVVCDEQGSMLDVVSFRFPEWTMIEGGSIIDKVRGSILGRFPDAAASHNEPLKFSPPKVHPKPDRVEISKRYRIGDQPSDPAGKLKLEEVDL